MNGVLKMRPHGVRPHGNDKFKTASLVYYSLCRNQKVYFFSGDFAGIFIFSSKNVLICCVCRWLINVAMDLNGPTYYDGCKLSLDECSGRPV